jgi:hypothetical protein
VTKVQSLAVAIMIVLLMLVVLLSTVHLGVVIGQQLWQPPQFLIPVQGLRVVPIAVLRTVPQAAGPGKSHFRTD